MTADASEADGLATSHCSDEEEEGNGMQDLSKLHRIGDLQTSIYFFMCEASIGVATDGSCTTVVTSSMFKI